MIKVFLIITVIFFNTQFCYAGYRFYSGGNLSSFNENNTFYRTNYVVGIDKTWEKNGNGLTFGFQLIERSCLMNDITMVIQNTDQGYNLDVLFSVKYLELPLMFTFKLKEWHDIKFGFNLGPSLAISLGDKSKSTYSKHFNFEGNPNFRSITENLYVEYDDPAPFLHDQHFSGFYLNTGFIIEYHILFTEFRYSHGINEFEYLYGLKMHGEKFRTFEFMLGFLLNNRK